MGRKKYIMGLFLGLMLILAGCDDMEWVEGEGGERVVGDVEDYRFEQHDTRDKVIYVYTPEQTFVWGASNVKFFESKDRNTIVKYTIGENGSIWDREIHIGEGQVKDYSTEYAELFSSTLKVIPLSGKGELVKEKEDGEEGVK